MVVSNALDYKYMSIYNDKSIRNKLGIAGTARIFVQDNDNISGSARQIKERSDLVQVLFDYDWSPDLVDWRNGLTGIFLLIEAGEDIIEQPNREVVWFSKEDATNCDILDLYKKHYEADKYIVIEEELWSIILQN